MHRNLRRHLSSRYLGLVPGRVQLLFGPVRRPSCCLVDSEVEDHVHHSGLIDVVAHWERWTEKMTQCRSHKVRRSGSRDSLWPIIELHAAHEL